MMNNSTSAPQTFSKENLLKLISMKDASVTFSKEKGKKIIPRSMRKIETIVIKLLFLLLPRN